WCSYATRGSSFGGYMFGPVGWNELVVILIIVLVIFGPKRLPELAEAMGKSIRKFKEASREGKEEVTTAVKQEETKREFFSELCDNKKARPGSRAFSFSK